MGAFPLACTDKLLSIGLLIKTRRLQRKIRQKDLSALTGLSTSTLGKIEAGTPSVEMRAYMTVLWQLGLLDEVFQEKPRAPSFSLPFTEHRVRLRKISEDDF